MGLSLVEARAATDVEDRSVKPSSSVLPVIVNFEDDDLTKPQFPSLINRSEVLNSGELPKGLELGLSFVVFEEPGIRNFTFELVLANRNLEFRQLGADTAQVRFLDPHNVDKDLEPPATYRGSRVDRAEKRCTLGWRYSEGQASNAAYTFIEVQNQKTLEIGFVPLAISYVSQSTLAARSMELAQTPETGRRQPENALRQDETEADEQLRIFRESKVDFSLDVEIEGHDYPRFSIFNYGLIPQGLLPQPTFIVSDLQELSLELRRIDGGTFFAKPNKFEADIRFFDANIEAIEPPREYLNNRLAGSNQWCRTFWRFDPEPGAKALSVSSFLVAVSSSPHQRMLGKPTWIDPTVIQPPPVNGGPPPS